MPDASPVKWHLAHTSWFFETVILAQRPGYRPFDPRFAYLFNSYYEALGPRHPRPRRGLLTRPTLDEVMAYRAHVDAAMAEACGDASAAADAIVAGPASRTAASGTDPHRHQARFLLQSAAAGLSPTDAGAAPRTQPLAMACASRRHRRRSAMTATALPSTMKTPRHQVLLRPFRIASRPVSNGEYRAFIADGGYRRAEFWLSDGWARVQEEGWEAPLYWLKDDDGSARQRLHLVRRAAARSRMRRSSM